MRTDKYMELLRSNYASKEEILSELLNLEAILSLPKGTELYISDIHGEYDAFNHILRTGSGNIKEKIYSLFGETRMDAEKDFLCLLVAYPKETLKLQHDNLSSVEINQWYEAVFSDLLIITQYCSSKYSRSKVRKALPKDYAYIIEEMLYGGIERKNKKAHYKNIAKRLVTLNIMESFIISLSKSIQRFVIDHVHVVGDIFDRGIEADKVMDVLLQHHSTDIQWGNHEILWIGAFSGNKACLATLLRIATRYNYLYNLETKYGLNLRPLFIFADTYYEENENFGIKYKNNDYAFENNKLLEKVHQAITIIQLKLEGQIIKRRPEFDMTDRLFFDNITNNSILLNDKTYRLSNDCFQTVDFVEPYTLTKEEEYVINSLMKSFQNSEKLKRHIDFLMKKGSVYLLYNNCLLLHGCIPMKEDKSFETFTIQNKKYMGKELLDQFEYHIRKGYESMYSYNDYSTDLMWYSWLGKLSPLYGRKKMTTFERYFIADEVTHIEEKNAYFKLRDYKNICKKILHEFQLHDDEEAKIINGHTPVKVKEGELPIKADGMLIVIDGGLSKLYQSETGIGGYTLLNNSYGFQIVTHQPFESIRYIFKHFQDNTIVKKVVEKKVKRKYIKDTTIAKSIEEKCDDLYELLDNYNKKDKK